MKDTKTLLREFVDAHPELKLLASYIDDLPKDGEVDLLASIEIPELTDQELALAIPLHPIRRRKTCTPRAGRSSITIRVPNCVLADLKKKARLLSVPYQTLINRELGVAARRWGRDE